MALVVLQDILLGQGLVKRLSCRADARAISIPQNISASTAGACQQGMTFRG